MYTTYGNTTCYGILFDFGCSTGCSANPTAAMLGMIEVIAYTLIITLVVYFVVKKLGGRTK